MSSRRVVVKWLFLVAILSLCTVFVLAGGATAEHDEPDDAEIVEVQVVTTSGTAVGEVEMEIGYHLDDAIVEFDVIISDPTVEVVELDGFSDAGGNTYEWDETTDYPTIRTVRQANISASPYEGLDYVDSPAMTLMGAIPTDVRFVSVGTGGAQPPAVERSIHVTSEETGSVEGRTMVFIGDHHLHTFESDSEQFRLVEAAGVDPWWTVDEMTEKLVDISNDFDVGGDDQTVTLFIVGDPIRVGGLASGEGSDFWVHETTLTPGHTTLWHEYVHTRQQDRRSDATEWTHEGEAEYYAYLFAMKQGEIDYHDFYRKFDSVVKESDGVILSDPDSWQGTRANYDLGGLTLAELDARIRSASDGANTYEDVLREKNELDGEVTSSAFESFAETAAGSDLGAFFDRSVHSTPEPIEPPPPTMYESTPDDASLQMRANDVTIEPGGTTIVRFELSNQGSETSLAPALEVTLPERWERGELDLNVHRGIGSKLSLPRGTIVFDNLEPGETVVLEYEVSAPESAPFYPHEIRAVASDLGGSYSDETVGVTVTYTPTVALALPASVIVDEGVTLDASGSSDQTGIDSYTWEIVGPDGETATFSTAGATTEYAFDRPGEHIVVVTAVNEHGGTDTVERTTVVTDRPTVSVDVPTNVDVGETVVLEALVTNEIGNYEVRWEIDGEQLRGEAVELTMQADGVYDVEVTVEDEYGGTTTEVVTITVGEPVEPGSADEDTDGDGTVFDEVGSGFGAVVAGVSLLLLLFLVRERS